MKRLLPSLLPTHLYNDRVSVYVYRRGDDRRMSVMHNQRVVGHAGAIILEDVHFRVQEGVRQVVISRKQKKPHAFVDGTLMQCSARIWGLESTDGIQVRYNPYQAGYFYNRLTGEPVHSARLCVVTPFGVLAYP